MLKVAFITDAQYAYCTAISITSLLAVSRPQAIYVVDAGLLAEQRDELRTLDCAIEVVAIPEAVNRWLGAFSRHGDKHVTAAAYTKLQLHQILPDVDKIIYLDSDTLILGDLRPLFDVDLTGHGVGATWNFSQRYLGRKRLGLSDDYFNSGVLVCPLETWREESIEQGYAKWYRENSGKMRFNDQEVLNGALTGRVKWIDKRWNVSHWEVFRHEPQLRLPFASISVLHFNGTPKPWRDDYALRWGLSPEHHTEIKKLIAPFAQRAQFLADHSPIRAG